MKLAVIIPVFRAADKVLDVLAGIGPEVDGIFVVDDACPDKTGKKVQDSCKDRRVKVLFQEKNEGVGGATLRGFREAWKQGFEILVKLDGDGQMDPALVSKLVQPIRDGKADYVKGNRFYSPRSLKGMPFVRVLGNAGLGFLAKLTTGYWDVSDPTNGFIALHGAVLPLLESERIEKRYFFENDLLFRLALVRAVVKDMPMQAKYGNEKSHLSVTHSFFAFPGKLFFRFLKRIFYRYFLRDFNIGSVLLVSGFFLFAGGAGFGAYRWMESIRLGVLASSGTVMVAALPVLLGFQMMTFAVLFDVLMTPKEPIFPFCEKIELSP